MNLSEWEQELKDILPEVIAVRRDLHRHPELSGQEERTCQKLTGLMQDLGFEIRHFDGTFGIMATLQNGPGKCIAIRADMDALPITEHTGLEFSSENAGVMHACGHDVHMALAYGSAMWFAKNRDRWSGTVRYLFEPSEETIGGGKAMVADGCMKSPDVDYVFGQHVNPRYTAGQFFAKPGYVSGSSDELYLTVYGRRTHGAYPEGGVDAILIAAHIVTALQSLISRTISPFQHAVVTMGTISGGTANNIVCGEVKLTGTLRTLNAKTRHQLWDEYIRLCEGIASGMGGSAEARVVPSYGYVYNDDKAYDIIERAAAGIIGEENIVRREQPSLGVDSFCYFVQDVPGVYYDIGSGISTPLHTDTFLVDENCLLPGIAMQIASFLALQKEV